MLVGTKWVDTEETTAGACDLQFVEEEDRLYDQLVAGRDPISVLSELSTRIQDNYFDLGCVLWHLKDSGEYTKVDEKYNQPNHGGWKDFCEEQLQGISYRTAQYWLNIYKYFSDMGIDKERINHLGWSKAKELVNFTEIPDKLEAAIDRAEELSVEDLKAYISTQQSVAGEDTRERVTVKSFRFALQEEPAIAVEQILNDIAKEECDGDLNSAFFKVVIEWQQLNFGKGVPSLNMEIQ